MALSPSPSFTSPRPRSGLPLSPRPEHADIVLKRNSNDRSPHLPNLSTTFPPFNFQPPPSPLSPLSPSSPHRYNTRYWSRKPSPPQERPIPRTLPASPKPGSDRTRRTGFWTIDEKHYIDTMSESPESAKQQSNKNSPKELVHPTLAATEKMRRSSVDNKNASIMSRAKNRVVRALSPSLESRTLTDKAESKDERQTSLGSVDTVPDNNAEEPAYALGLGIETVQRSHSSDGNNSKRKKNKHDVYEAVQHWTDGTF
jgi:hypothetical protein